MINISIIVPVFNIETKLLVRCIESLLNQTLNNIEIILVDDCSTNKETIAILDKYKSNQSIVLVKHKINKKQGGARNTGLKIANGAFIGFVDADDYVDKNMYKLLYDKAIIDNADIVDCDYQEVDKNSNIIKKLQSIKHIDKHNKILDCGRFVTKIIKTTLILDNNIYFPENMFYEDSAISGLHILYAKKVSKINQYLYYYVRHSNSTVSNVSLHLDDKIKAGKIFYDTMKKRGFLTKYKNDILIKYFEIYFKSTYRLVMKYDNNYFNILNNIMNEMKKNGVNIESQDIKRLLKNKEKFELWLLLNMPYLFKLYINIKYNKYKGIK